MLGKFGWTLGVPIGSEHHSGEVNFAPLIDPMVVMFLGLHASGAVYNASFGFGYIVMDGFGVFFHEVE